LDKSDMATVTRTPLTKPV